MTFLRRITVLFLVFSLSLPLGAYAFEDEYGESGFYPALFYDEWYRPVYIDEFGEAYYVDVLGYPTYLGTPVDDHYDVYGEDYQLPFYEVNGVYYRRELLNFKRVNTYTPGMFSDVPEGQWYSSSIAAVYELGLMNGTGGGRFNPDGNVTMAETLALAARISSIYKTGNGEFTQGSPWYQVYRDYTDANSYTVLWDDYSFDPNEPVTREAFAIMLASTIPVRPDTYYLPHHIYNKNDWKAINEIFWKDIKDINDGWYDPDLILRLYKAGVITGSDAAGTFHPLSPITRKEAAAIIERVAFPEMRKHFTPTTHMPIGEITCYEGTCMPTVESILGLEMTREYDIEFESGAYNHVFEYAGAAASDYKDYCSWIFDYADGVTSQGSIFDYAFADVMFGPLSELREYSIEYSADDGTLCVFYRGQH